MFQNLRDWWRKQSLRKTIERLGKGIARGLWNEIKQLVQTAEDSGMSGVEKYEWVKDQLVKKHGRILLNTKKDAVLAWLNTAIELAVSLLDDNLKKVL